ncbi:hypothetical protein G3I76_27450 [Streptomyces sp. SID11233]|nr:hypothetical protein [Streptomyces sp. SID11233]
MSPEPPGTAELALAAVRVTRGMPTAEEVAVLAVLLTARLRMAQDAETAEAEGEVLVPTVWRHPGAGFRMPGAWAS